MRQFPVPEQIIRSNMGHKMVQNSQLANGNLAKEKRAKEKRAKKMALLGEEPKEGYDR